MKRWGRFSRYGLVAVAGLLPLALFNGQVQVEAQDADGVVGTQSAGLALQTAVEIEAYWTPERRASAFPMELAAPTAATTARAQQRARAQRLPGPPGFVAGSEPTVGIQLGAAMQLDVVPQTSPPFVPPSTPTDFGNYAPFQRWTHFGNYFTYPISTVGRLFFTQGGGGFVCSASVIARNTIATAGHCVHAGNGSGAGWSSALNFCPSYSAAGASRGCWAWTGVSFTSTAWFNGNIDRDYACVVTAATGTMFAVPLGDVTGTTGRAFNWPTRQAEFALGYPAAAPFPGFHIVTATSTEWYQIDQGGGAFEGATNHLSKYIGNDMTGGSSGGPWWISYRHPNAAFDYPDIDGSAFTDPPSFGAGARSGGPYINGVNSHKRCAAGGCPPGSIFTQEMGSPQFLNSAGDGGESEDVFAACFASGGT